MPSFRKRYEAKQRNEVVRDLKRLIKLVESGKYSIEQHGLWPGIDGKQNYKLIIKDKTFLVSSE